MGIVPFLITLPWTFSLINSTAASLFAPKALPIGHDLPVLVKAYGYVPFAMGLLGTFWLALKGGVKNYGIVLGLLLMVALLAIFYSLHYGVDLIYLNRQLDNENIIEPLAEGLWQVLEQLGIEFDFSDLEDKSHKEDE